MVMKLFRLQQYLSADIMVTRLFGLLADCPALKWKSVTHHMHPSVKFCDSEIIRVLIVANLFELQQI